MRSFFLASLLSAIVLLPASAADPASAFEQANRDFAAGDFAKAEAAYRALTDGPLVSPELFFNLGNAAYRQDRPGEAALWYRRALALDPRFAEARQNLEVIKKRTGCHEFSLQGWEAYLSQIQIGEWVALLSVGTWLALLAVAAAWLVPRLREYRPLLFSIAGVAAALAIFSAWSLKRQRELLSPDTLAIVTAADTAAVTGPEPEAAKVIDLPPGSELRIIQSAGPWTYVGIPNDLRGWVRTESIGKVLADRS